MNKMKIFKKSLISSLLLLLFLVSASTSLIAQKKKNDDLKNFKITVEQTQNGIKMHSVEGSAWIDLQFGLNKDQRQAIDQFGMTEMAKIPADKSSIEANYLFTIANTKTGFSLRGLKGTTWKDLSFTFPKNGKVTIHQFGVTTVTSRFPFNLF